MLEKRLAKRLEMKKAALDALRPLSPLTLQRLNEQFTLEWTYNSNAIEGNTLTLRETQYILETGLTIGGKSLREHLEVTNHREALHYVQDFVNGNETLTPFHIRQIHQLVLAKIDDEHAGQYRKVPVRIAGTNHRQPDAREIPALMNDWHRWLQSNPDDFSSIEIAAMAHHKLVAIHPFIDGNGRTARLVMNLLLMQAHYPPAIIMTINRRQYYSVLTQADRGKFAPLINFVGRAIERSLNMYLEAGTPQIEAPVAEDEWLLLRDAAIGTPYSQDYLSLLARKGRLDAQKRGRNWVTTRRAIEDYRLSVEGKNT